METLQKYRSFNNEKSIEELQYNITRNINSIENLKFELKFYQSLLSKPIYKNNILNLYEKLVKFKGEIDTINKISIDLLNELKEHVHQILIKIECEDIACDNIFIKKHDAVELKVYNLKIKIFNFKFRLFQYVESVIND